MKKNEVLLIVLAVFERRTKNSLNQKNKILFHKTFLRNFLSFVCIKQNKGRKLTKYHYLFVFFSLWPISVKNLFFSLSREPIELQALSRIIYLFI